MYYCLICDRKYKTDQSYNDHLNRKQHKTNLIKLESLYSMNPHSNAYKQWKVNREQFDKKKEVNKKTDKKDD